jgi:hypothetical protein
MTKSLNLLQRLEASSSPVSLTEEDRRVLDFELDETLKSIANCDTVEAAEPFLLELGEIQDVMATLAFKHDLQLSKRQREIVREYDRWDAQRFDGTLFEKSKTPTFPVMIGINGSAIDYSSRHPRTCPRKAVGMAPGARWVDQRNPTRRYGAATEEEAEKGLLMPNGRNPRRQLPDPPGWLPIADAICRVADGRARSITVQIDPALIGSSDQRHWLEARLLLLPRSLNITTRIVLKKGRPWTGKVTVVRRPALPSA